MIVGNSAFCATVVRRRSTYRSLLRVWRISAVRLSRNALEGRLVALNLHQLAGTFIPLLPMAVGPLELRPARDGAPPVAISGVPRHAPSPDLIRVVDRITEYAGAAQRVNRVSQKAPDFPFNLGYFVSQQETL
jgi:hypothetical protein